jgi:hypothetical protein
MTTLHALPTNNSSTITLLNPPLAVTMSENQNVPLEEYVENLRVIIQAAKDWGPV